MKHHNALRALGCALLLALAAAAPSQAAAPAEGEEVRVLGITVSYVYDYLEGTGDAWVHYQAPDIQLDDPEAWPALDAALKEFSAGEQQDAKTMVEDYLSWQQESEAAAGEAEPAADEAETAGEGSGDLFYESTVSITRADSRVVSICRRIDSYSGGAHPNTGYLPVTFDTATGAELTLTDVLQKPDELPELLEAALLDLYDKDVFFTPDLAEVIREEMSPTETYTNEETGEEVVAPMGPAFTLDYDGITFWFSPYELAPYAAGEFVQKLYFSDYPDLVKPEYCEAAADYIVPLRAGQAIRLPENGAEFTWFTNAPEDVDADTELTISTTGASFTETLYGFDFSGWLMRQDGKNFFIAGISMPDDYTELHLFDLSGVPSGTFTEPVILDRSFESSTPTDPDRVFLIHSTDMLSTFHVRCPYRFDENGQAVPLADWEEIIDHSNEYFEMALTTKQELTADTVDADKGVITGSAAIPAGTKLHFVRTDCESWVDLRDEAGTIYRIYTNALDGWPQQVDGKNAEDVFDGIMYAG